MEWRTRDSPHHSRRKAKTSHELSEDLQKEGEREERKKEREQTNSIRKENFDFQSSSADPIESWAETWRRVPYSQSSSAAETSAFFP
jgi:hypothetical protein